VRQDRAPPAFLLDRPDQLVEIAAPARGGNLVTLPGEAAGDADLPIANFKARINRRVSRR
jgi:hypothetical protein